MILAATVQQITSYKPVAHELEERLKSLQVNLGYKVINVFETTIHDNQGFIILYEIPDDCSNVKCVTDEDFKTNNWISVNEELPTEDGYYIVTDINKTHMWVCEFLRGTVTGWNAAYEDPIVAYWKYKI